MSSKDITSKRYLSNPAYFADAFNFHLYGGRQIVLPDTLKAVDTTELTMPYGDGAKQAVQKFRDIMKQWIIMSDQHAVYALLGIETQTNIHYAMPVRNMLYDALNYDKQVHEAAVSYRSTTSDRSEGKSDISRHENADNPHADIIVSDDIVGQRSISLTREEYLSGFRKEDRLIPVITLVVFLNPSVWDGARSIHEMLAVQDEHLLQYVPNYKLNLLAPAEISAPDFRRFHTGLGKTLEFVKNSDDKNKMKQMLKEHGTFMIDRDSVEMIQELTNINIRYTEEDTEVDMCKAWDDWGEEMRQEERTSAIKILAETLKDLGVNSSDIIKKIHEKYGLSTIDAAKFI